MCEYHTPLASRKRQEGNVVFYLKMTLYGCVFFSQEGIGHHPLEGRIFVLLQNICGAFYKYVLFSGGDV